MIITLHEPEPELVCSWPPQVPAMAETLALTFTSSVKLPRVAQLSKNRGGFISKTDSSRHR